jgi:hypothetical protein
MISGVVLPEEAGIGATPHRRAKAASLGIVAGSQQQCRRHIGSDPLEGQQLRGGRGDQPVQVPVQLGDLGR